MNVSFYLKEKEIHKIYKKYLLSKDKKMELKKGNPIELEGLGESNINLEIKRTGIFLSYDGVSIEVKFNKIKNIEKFKEFIVIENTVVDIVVPIDSFKPEEEVNLFLEELRTSLNEARYGKGEYDKEGYNYALKNEESLLDGYSNSLDNSLYEENKNLKEKKAVIVNINDKSKNNLIVLISLIVVALIIVLAAAISYLDYRYQESNNLSKATVVATGSGNSNNSSGMMNGNMGFINGNNENSNDNVLFTKDYDYETINGEAKKYYQNAINEVKNDPSFFHMMTRSEGKQFIDNSNNGVSLNGSYEENAITYFSETIELGIKANTMSSFQNHMVNSERGIAELSQMNPGPVYNSIKTMAVNTAALQYMMETCSGYSSTNVIAELDNELPKEAVINYINKKNLLTVPTGYQTEFYMGPVEITTNNQLYRTVLVNEITSGNKNIVQSRLYEVYENGDIKSIG